MRHHTEHVAVYMRKETVRLVDELARGAGETRSAFLNHVFERLLEAHDQNIDVNTYRLFRYKTVTPARAVGTEKEKHELPEAG